MNSERANRTAIMRARLPHLGDYEVVIVGTRYGGVYEGAAWVAWPGEPEWLDDYAAGDNACAEFWQDYANAPLGRGEDPNGALADLMRQVAEAKDVDQWIAKT
jgi:hypothetical protein